MLTLQTTSAAAPEGSPQVTTGHYQQPPRDQRGTFNRPRCTPLMPFDDPDHPKTVGEAGEAPRGRAASGAHAVTTRQASEY